MLDGKTVKVLITYGSTHGHTGRIAEHMAARMRQRGAEVIVTERPLRQGLAGFDAIVVGGRVHGSRYPWRTIRFIRRNLVSLRSRPSAFFSVSLLQLARSAAQRSRTENLPAQLLPKLGWTPDRTEVIAGALFWKAQYGILTPLFKRMWCHTLGNLVDPALEEQVFTDWAQVDRFADSFLELATPRVEAKRSAQAYAHGAPS